MIGIVFPMGTDLKSVPIGRRECGDDRRNTGMTKEKEETI
jgi:hypothetical protein